MIYLIRYNSRYNAFLGILLFPLLLMRIVNEDCVRKCAVDSFLTSEVEKQNRKDC